MKKYLLTKKALLIITALTLLLTACIKETAKEAYCFSIVFERLESDAKVSMYCKTSGDTDGSSMENITLTFEAADFREAMKKADRGKYNIYFNSIQAYFLSGNLGKDDLKDITLLLLDNAKYKTDNNVLYDKNITAEKLHSKAKSVCDNDGILRNEKNIYSSSIDIFRMLFRSV